MYKLFCLSDMDQQAYAVIGALTLQDIRAEIRGTANGAARYLMENGVPDFEALQMEEAMRKDRALLEISLDSQNEAAAAKTVLRDMGVTFISPSNESKQELSGEESQYAYLDYKSTWDTIDSEPHDAYADGTRFLFDSGTFDVGENYPRGV